ncbi:MAG: GldG family protein [Lachnospiraceae bacterium]|nr:GldG family protein [Lachnospiraceae bacterium]
MSENKDKKIEKKPSKIKKSFSSRIFKTGVYTTIISVMVIVIVVVLNMLITKLDLTTDMSSGKIYSLSKETKDIIKNAKDKITIYYMVTDGNEQENIYNAVKSYNKVDSNVKVEKKDPVIYPTFGEKLGIDDEISDNDIIVYNENTKAVKYISNAAMYFTAFSSSGDMSGESLDVEGQVTAAIQYVLSSEHTKMYMLTGHGEVALEDSVIKDISKLNVDTDNLDLVTEGKVPDDCDILLMAGPTSDIKKTEYEEIKSYLKDGGDAIIFAELTEENQENLGKLMKYYGVEVEKGFVGETAGKYYASPFMILPTVSDSGVLSKLAESDEYVYMFFAQNLKTTDEQLRSTLSIQGLLSSSGKSFFRTDLNNSSTEKTDDDKTGPFDVGLYVTDEAADDVTKIAIYSSAEMLSDKYIGLGNNKRVLTDTISSMTKSSVKETSISVKNLQEVQISVPVSSRVILAALLIIILPATLLIMGFVVWGYRRRK